MLIKTESFLRVLEKCLKHYPLSKQDTEDYIKKDFESDADQGDRCPGYGEIEVRKLRISLEKYKLGKSHGLRLLYLVERTEKGQSVLPFFIYKKGFFAKESQAVADAKRVLKEALLELQGGKEPVEGDSGREPA